MKIVSIFSTCKLLSSNKTITQIHIREFWETLFADLTNAVCYNFPYEALMNTVPSYENADRLKPISYNFLIWRLIKISLVLFY